MKNNNLTKLELLTEKLSMLPKNKFIAFLAEWHGKQYLWDNFKQSVDLVAIDEGEEEIIEQINNVLESCNIKL